MEDHQKILNYECNYNIYMINNLMHRNFRSPADRSKILLWVKKLQKYNTNIDDMYMRNDFIYYLLTCVKNGDLRSPFNAEPNEEHLENFQKFLPTSAKDETDDKNRCKKGSVDEEEHGLPHIYKKSPDGGAFLSAQPIPKCGVFCYLAITGKTTTEGRIDD